MFLLEEKDGNEKAYIYTADLIGYTGSMASWADAQIINEYVDLLIKFVSAGAFAFALYLKIYNHLQKRKKEHEEFSDYVTGSPAALRKLNGRQRRRNQTAV